MPEPSENFKILQRSVAKSDYPTNPYEGNTFRLFIPMAIGSKLPLLPQLPSYWSLDRDRILRSTVHAEPMWAGAIGIAITKMASMSWQVESGVALRQRRAQKLLLEAGGINLGWVQFISRHLRDFLTTDNGAFTEIIRSTSAYGSRIIGLRHLDSQRCIRTGDAKIPVLYYDRKGKPHEMKDYQVFSISDMPDPSDAYYGVGVCAASRAYGEIYKLSAIEWYIREKVTGLTPLAIHIVNGVLDKQIRNAVEVTTSEKIAQGVVSYMGATIIGSPSEQPPNLVTIPLAELPDRFNRKEEFDIGLLSYANALGVDLQDLQPLSGGPLGTGAQSQVLHEKGLGKGLSAWRQAFAHLINMYVFDELTTFTFVEQDTADMQSKAAVSQARASVASTRITSKITTPAQELRWLIEHDELPREYLPLTDRLDTETSLSDLEKPEHDIEGLLAAEISDKVAGNEGETSQQGQQEGGIAGPIKEGPSLADVGSLPIPEKTDAQIQSEQDERVRMGIDYERGLVSENRMNSREDRLRKEENESGSKLRKEELDREEQNRQREFDNKLKLEQAKLQGKAGLQKLKKEELARQKRAKKKLVTKKELEEQIVASFKRREITPTQEQFDLAMKMVLESIGEEEPQESPKSLDLAEQTKQRLLEALKGGPGSGFFSPKHHGRPGKVGGSTSVDSSPKDELPERDTEKPKKTEEEEKPEKIEYVVANPKGRLTYTMYRDRNGNWTEQRKELHEKIIAKMFEGKTPVENPESWMTGGGSASGKSSLLGSGDLTIPENTIKIDSDWVKEQLPEYIERCGFDERAANYVHEESSYIAKLAMKRAIDGGYNVLLDGTGDGRISSILAKIGQLTANGRKLHAYYTTCDLKDALERNVARSLRHKFHRKPQERIVKSTHISVSKIFPRIAKTGAFKELYLFDTTVLGHPKMIFSYLDGKSTVYDKSLYQKFLEKRNIK